MPKMKEYDVIIVGGGPVGLGLAIELGQRGIHVAVIERYLSLQLVPKGQNLTQRTMEHFHFWGCEDELRSRRHMPAGVANGGMVCYGTILGKYRYEWLPREKVAPYYYAKVERLPQFETEAALRARAAQISNIDTFYGWASERFVEDEDGVTLDICEHKGALETKKSIQLRAKYLVGCDGSNSRTREDAGISETSTEHDKKMVLLLLRSTELHKLLSQFPTKAFYNAIHPDLQGYWQFLGRVDVGETWFFHAPVPKDTTSDNFDFAAFLHKAVGTEFALEIDYIGFWDLRFAIANSYKKGRILVAGDAAHSHPPYGGFGINTGFEDARNLGWKLAAILQGWGHASLLDTYDEERRPVFQTLADDFIENFIVEDKKFLEKFSPEINLEKFETEWAKRGQATSEVMAYEPNYDGSSIVFGNVGNSPSAAGSHMFAARAGHHLAPAQLSDGRNAFEALGPGFTLFDFSADGLVGKAFGKAARKLTIPLNVVHDPKGAGAEIYQANLILVRPDQFVAWAGDNIDPNATQILLKVTGAQSIQS